MACFRTINGSEAVGVSTLLGLFGVFVFYTSKNSTHSSNQVASIKEVRNIKHAIHSSLQKSISTPPPPFSAALFQIRHLLLQHLLKAKRLKRYAITLEMLTHGLDPVQTERMQHGTRALHDDQNGNREHEPEVEETDGGDDTGGAGHGEGDAEGHAPEDDGELLMGEGEGPEAEVGGGVGDAVETEFCREISKARGR